MQKVKITNLEVINYLEALSVEIEARMDVVTFMLDRGMNTSSEQFAAYHKELVEFKAKFEAAKRQFQEAYISPVIPDGKNMNWSLDYKTATVTLTEVPM